LNTVTVTITTPKNETISVKNIANFTVLLPDAGNYTLTFHWGSWIPLLGRVVEMVTGSGNYRLTIVKKAPFPIQTVAIIIGGVSAAVVLVVIFGRRTKGKVWQK